ncbi:MAG: hypothetical protein AB9873_04955 [Syntrophobacteraceae bacterium]
MGKVDEKEAYALARTVWLDDPVALRGHMRKVLYRASLETGLASREVLEGLLWSSVLLLVGRQKLDGELNGSKTGARNEICLILNKRSRSVRQAGDLCCPGGTVEPHLDPKLARLLSLPGMHLRMWGAWKQFRGQRPQEARFLSLLLATCLRESWEEMRLNPFKMRFLGFLPSQRLRLYRRVIYPMVGWLSGQSRFVPSWEVDRIICIPIRTLFEVERYARYRLYVPEALEAKFHRGTEDFPCFVHSHGNHTEVLWGATYKIVMTLIERVFRFKPPDAASLPLVPGVLDEGYIFGWDRCER